MLPVYMVVVYVCMIIIHVLAWICAWSEQANVIAQALSCVDPSKADVAGECAAASAVGNGVSGDEQQQRDKQRERQREKQCLVLSNTNDNETLQGLVRSDGWLWLGTFGLPPLPPGEVDPEVRGGRGSYHCHA